MALQMYKIVKNFPPEERYGLTSQIKRAATSIPLNIAEGYGKEEGITEFKRFLRMSLGSESEMQVLIELSKDLEFIDTATYAYCIARYQEIGKMLHGMIRSWK